ELLPDKSTRQVRLAPEIRPGLLGGEYSEEWHGYEIHLGRTVADPGTPPAFSVCDASGDRRPDGALNPAGNVLGTYIHGLFDNDGLRRSLIYHLLARRGLAPPENVAAFSREREYQRLAEAVRAGLDLDRVREIAGIAGRR